VKPATLQRLMRHRSIETALKFYVAQDADEVADESWRHQTDKGGRGQAAATIRQQPGCRARIERSEE
jgi:hypothetical protein